MSDEIDLRQLGASAICGLQEAIGVAITYHEALKRWDALSEQDQEWTLEMLRRPALYNSRF